MWEPVLDEEVAALHTESLVFEARCPGALSCSAVFEPGALVGATVEVVGDTVTLRVPEQPDLFDLPRIWLYGRDAPIVGWPSGPLPGELVGFDPPEEHLARASLRCTAQVLDEAGQAVEVVTVYEVLIEYDFGLGLKLFEEVFDAGSGQAGG